MQYYAIQNKKTGRYIAGTDWNRNGRPRQIYSTQMLPPMLFCGAELGNELLKRQISLAHYQVVVLEVRRAEL